MKVYKKLVRDNIPEIIMAKGDIAITRILSDEEFSEYLAKKLCEEAQEFLTDGTVEELADIYEVLLTILEHMNISFDAFEDRRKNKAIEKGRFSKKILLDSIVKQGEYITGDNENGA